MANLRQRNPPHHLHDHLRPTDHLLCIDNTGWRWRRWPTDHCQFKTFTTLLRWERVNYPKWPQVVPPPTSLPLHPTTNDNFPEDIRGYTHIPGPAPKLPRCSTRFHRHSSPLGARFPHGVTVCLPLTTMTPLACTLDLHTNNNNGQKARHTREGRLATFGRYVDLNIFFWRLEFLGYTLHPLQWTECPAQSIPHLLLLHMKRSRFSFSWSLSWHGQYSVVFKFTSIMTAGVETATWTSALIWCHGREFEIASAPLSQ